MTEASSPPDDIAALKRLIAARDEMIAQLMAEIARLKRWQYGRSAERADQLLSQLALPLDDLGGEIASHSGQPERPEDNDEKSDGERVVRLRRKPRAFPSHLPRETVLHQPAHCACPECGGALRKLGEDFSEVLDFVPGYFKVIRHVRPKLSCAKCSNVVQAPAPARPIDRGMAGAWLLAQVVVAKYADHCPLYRQEAIYRRAGLQLERATLAAWVGEASHLLRPLVDALGRYVRGAEKLHADDTPVPVLDPGRGQTKTGRVWTYVRDDRPAGSRAPPAVWYRYSPDRKGEHPRAHLKGFQGILQADGYSGFGALYASGRIQEAACWAHARRKFYDIWVADRSPIAAEAVRRIGLLYAIEREIGGKLPHERQAVRQSRSAPILGGLYDWLSATLQQVSTKSHLAKAIHYSLARWEALTRFCSDGRIEVDNNTAERSIRPIVLGRRNYLFAGSDAGGERAANIYTLIGTALLNDVEPYAYLRALFERTAEHPVNRLDELFPWKLDLPPAASLARAA
jgi:transposase